MRFWRWDELYEGRPAWIGAATFDERVGLSHIHTSHRSDVDAERDRIANQLQKRGWCSRLNGMTDSTQSLKGTTAAVILGTPLVV